MSGDAQAHRVHGARGRVARTARLEAHRSLKVWRSQLGATAPPRPAAGAARPPADRPSLLLARGATPPREWNRREGWGLVA